MNDDELTVSARIKKFDNRHGNFVRIDDFWLLFEDGARREVNCLGALKEPPEDNYECSKLIIRYYQQKLNLSVEEFSVHKRNLLMDTRNRADNKFPPPSKEAIDNLRKLKIKVTKCQNRLREAQVNLEHHKPEQLVQREQQGENNQSACHLVLSEIESIEV